MLARFRRWRAMAALLVAMSPPAAGTILPIIDPCPVDLPWLADNQSAGDHAHHEGAGTTDAPEGSGHHQSCHCVGACAGPAAVPHPSSVETVTPVPGVALATGAGREIEPLDLARPSFVLPFANAPPIA